MTQQNNEITKWASWLNFALNKDSGVTWDSLIIDRRKPVTYRAWTFLPNGKRICLHMFTPCAEEESFKHPHAWPAEFLILHGEYREIIYIDDIVIVDSIFTDGSWHSLDNKRVQHRVIPIKNTWTIMINGSPYDDPHPDVVTTKGKDLKKMTAEQLEKHLNQFRILLGISDII